MFIDISKNISSYNSYSEIMNYFTDFSKKDSFIIQNIGLSENLEPIKLLSYISNKNGRNILIFGGEDASEPIFSQTIYYLISELTNKKSQIHKFNLNWHFISCINPDGYLKNEGWIKHPGDLKSFFENSWEDIHSKMIFWKTEERREHKALNNAIKITQPNLIYNLHDESHFPADGYKFIFSEEFNLELLNEHLSKIKEIMDISNDELVITNTYGHDPKFSISSAFQSNKNIFAFSNESCGYKRINKESPKIFVTTNDILYHSLKEYKQLQIENYDSILESSLFHTNILIKSIENNEEFNSKMLSITGYGLEYLRSKNIRQANEIKDIFLDHINSNFKDSYSPVSVSNQIFTQLDFLFAILEIKNV